MPYDRTAQRKVFADLVKPTFDLQDASDAAADAILAVRNSLPALNLARQKAELEFQEGIGTGAAVDSSRAAVAKTNGDNSTLTKASADAYNLWLASQVKLEQAAWDLRVNPGAVEDVSHSSPPMTPGA